MRAADLEDLQRRSGYTLRLWTESEYEKLLKDPLTVITQDAYGFAIGRLIDDEAELLMIAIVQERQGLGNGKQHLQLFEAIVTRKGAKFCFLEVSESNINARALYQAQNFKEIGRRKAYYQIHENNRMDAIIMRKSFEHPLNFK